MVNSNTLNIRCCLEVPPSFLPKAQYALRMLLLPLGYDPLWVSSEDLAAEGGIYYGMRNVEEHTDVIVTIPYAKEAVHFFEGDAPISLSQVTKKRWEGESWPILFRDQGGNADLIASTFYWLSGWQEVTIRIRDQHGRFPYEASLQAQLGTAMQPYVDAYRAWLAERFEAQGFTLHNRKWVGRTWALCPTHDVDYLRKWRLGMIYREVMHYLLLNHRNVTGAERITRFGSFLRDAVSGGDVYRKALKRMPREVEKVGGTATFFFKMGAHGDRDVAYSPMSSYLKSYVAMLRREGFEIGLHPSFHAHNHLGYLRQERQRLINISGNDPRSVRQHFLRYDPSQTGRYQAKAGFQIDSSLGFATSEGFRHGTCMPFQLFDLRSNGPLELWEMPLSLMEAALFNRRNLSLEGALDAAVQVIHVCKRFGGVAVMLWHNVLWDELDAPAWGAHFTRTLEVAAEKGALIASLDQALKGWQ